jgi:hypothetical protein
LLLYLHEASKDAFELKEDILFVWLLIMVAVFHFDDSLAKIWDHV